MAVITGKKKIESCEALRLIRVLSDQYRFYPKKVEVDMHEKGKNFKL